MKWQIFFFRRRKYFFKAISRQRRRRYRHQHRQLNGLSCVIGKSCGRITIFKMKQLLGSVAIDSNTVCVCACDEENHDDDDDDY